MDNEPEIEKMPRWARFGFMLACAVALWGMIFTITDLIRHPPEVTWTKESLK